MRTLAFSMIGIVGLLIKKYLDKNMLIRLAFMASISNFIKIKLEGAKWKRKENLFLNSEENKKLTIASVVLIIIFIIGFVSLIALNLIRGNYQMIYKIIYNNIKEKITSKKDW